MVVLVLLYEALWSEMLPRESLEEGNSTRGWNHQGNGTEENSPSQAGGANRPGKRAMRDAVELLAWLCARVPACVQSTLLEPRSVLFGVLRCDMLDPAETNSRPQAEECPSEVDWKKYLDYLIT